MSTRLGDGYDSHRKVLTAFLHELPSWEAREAKAAEIVDAMRKGGLLQAKSARGPKARGERP